MNNGENKGGSGWDNFKLTPLPDKPKKTKEQVVLEAQAHANTWADSRRADRAIEIKSTLLPFVVGSKEVKDRDQSKNMNLTGDSVSNLQRRYSIGTQAEFQKLLPSNAQTLNGHKDDVEGKPGFKGNMTGPYINYVFSPTSTRPGINAHVRLGESQHYNDYVSGYSQYMFKHEKDWK